MPRSYLYLTAVCLTVIGFGMAIMTVLELRHVIAAVNANAPVIEIDNSVAFIAIGIACGTLGLVFFKLLSISDMADPRRSIILNRQFIFMGVCLVLSPIGYFSFPHVCAAVLEPRGYVATTVFVGRSQYRVTEWRRPASTTEPAK